MNPYEELHEKLRENLVEFDKLQDEYKQLQEQEKRDGGYRRDSHARRKMEHIASQMMILEEENEEINWIIKQRNTPWLRNKIHREIPLDGEYWEEEEDLDAFDDEGQEDFA